MCDCDEFEQPDDDEDDDLSLRLDTDDPEFLRGFQIGQMWERLHHHPSAVLMVATKSAELVMRMAEKKKLPFSATIFDDEWTLAAIGVPADLDAEISDS